MNLNNIKLSVIIPSYHDPLAMKTVDSLLQNSELGDRLEVIDVWDGFFPTFEIVEDPRVRYCHLGQNGGMRNAINCGVRLARGEFIMRTDEHCMFGPGYDRILTETCQPDWMVAPVRYFLDPVKWERMDLPPVVYEKLKIQNTERSRKFSGAPWQSRTRRNAHLMIDENMMIQGSCWLMPHKLWDDVIGELNSTGYGPLTQDQTEMIMKLWQAGGKLMVNKHTWFAHKHRSYPRTHNTGGADSDASFAYSLSVWEQYYRDVVQPKWRV